MKKLPYGISDYERIQENNYYYVDKTEYIEKLENLSEPYIMFLRPRKFGKTLFTSALENYYDIKKKDKFESLFGETYIGKNPTKLKNSYHILKFNFSGIDTMAVESTIQGFKIRVANSINLFVNQYDIEFYVNYEQEAEDMLDSLFKAFEVQKQEEKIYVIIDEYDHFANELLGFYPEQFKDLVSKNGKVRKWYEILKKGTESVVDRIFITGVAPITLDSMTSGFNIASDLTQDRNLNEMMGFTNEELIKMMSNQEIGEEKQKELLPIMKENYDGYKFSLKANERIYNSNMCLYFLNEYVKYKEIPEELIDMNIASDYNKVGNMLKLCRNENRLDIIERTVLGERIPIKITRKFNPEIEFGEVELVSMLYYLGYLTIVGENLGRPELKIPNQVMREIYADYFMKLMNEESNLTIDMEVYDEILQEIALEGKIDSITKLVEKYLKNLSNRDFIKFSEKYIKLMFYGIVMNFDIYNVKSEMEIERGYSDLMLIPRDKDKGYYSIMIEFKYLNKEKENELEEKQKEAREQIEKYCNTLEIKDIRKINKYTVVAVNDQIYVEKID